MKRSFDDHITVDWRQQRHRRERRRGALIARKLDPHLESQTAHAKTSMKAVCCRLQLASRDLGETLAHRVQHHGKPRQRGLTATVPTHAIICSIHDWVRWGGEWEVIVDPRGLDFTSEPAEPEVC